MNSSGTMDVVPRSPNVSSVGVSSVAGENSNAVYTTVGSQRHGVTGIVMPMNVSVVNDEVVSHQVGFIKSTCFFGLFLYQTICSKLSCFRVGITSKVLIPMSMEAHNSKERLLRDQHQIQQLKVCHLERSLCSEGLTCILFV